MTQFWINQEGNFIFATPDNLHPNFFVVNATQISTEDVARRLGAGWLDRKMEIIRQWGIDPSRPRSTYLPAYQEEAMVSARNIGQLLERQRNQPREGLQGINLEEEEDKPKKSRKRKELKVSEIPEREDNLRPFKLPYQTFDEINMRLHDTIIGVKSKPFLVTRLEPDAGDYTLQLQDVERDTYTVPYSLPELDCRTPELGYGVAQDGMIQYVIRRPERAQTQGISSTNALKKRVGMNSWQIFQRREELLHLLSNRPKRVITPGILETMKEGLIPYIFLSKKIVLVTKKTGITAEYRGRFLGHVKDNIVLLSDDDQDMSHIKNDLREVGLEV